MRHRLAPPGNYFFAVFFLGEAFFAAFLGAAFFAAFFFAISQTPNKRGRFGQGEIRGDVGQPVAHGLHLKLSAREPFRASANCRNNWCRSGPSRGSRDSTGTRIRRFVSNVASRRFQSTPGNHLLVRTSSCYVSTDRTIELKQLCLRFVKTNVRA